MMYLHGSFCFLIEANILRLSEGKQTVKHLVATNLSCRKEVPND